jgi:hypothetical protein
VTYSYEMSSNPIMRTLPDIQPTQLVQSEAKPILAYKVVLYNCLPMEKVQTTM